jgi:hypothetical protein
MKVYGAKEKKKLKKNYLLQNKATHNEISPGLGEISLKHAVADFLLGYI